MVSALEPWIAWLLIMVLDTTEEIIKGVCDSLVNILENLGMHPLELRMILLQQNKRVVELESGKIPIILLISFYLGSELLIVHITGTFKIEIQ